MKEGKGLKEEEEKKEEEKHKQIEWELENMYYIKAVKLMINSIEVVQGKVNRILLVTYIMNYLKEHHNLIGHHKDLRLIVQNKLIKYIQNDEMSEVIDYYRDIFGNDGKLHEAVHLMQKKQQEKLL